MTVRIEDRHINKVATQAL